jgi:type VI secretion system protein ImpG
MLGAKGDDPDVERLLEGVAFLSSLIRRQLSEGYPELIQSLLWLACPRLILPVPSHTMTRFQPARGFTEAIKLPKGAQLASVKVDGVAARFSTSTDLTILPAAVSKVSTERHRGDQAVISLTVSSAAPLSRWLPPSLSIHFAGDYPEASERRRLLLDYSASVEAEVRGRTVTLSPSKLLAGGFDRDSGPLWRPAFWGFDPLQAYFTMPQQFLFLTLDGLEPLASAPDTTLTLRFRLSGLTADPPAMREEHFLLNVCPAVNVFPHPAQPLVIDHRANEYLLKPQDWETEKLDIYHVDKVSSISSDGQIKNYLPYEFISESDKDTGLYYVSNRPSPVSEKLEHYINPLYREGQATPSRETLSVSLLCHNVDITDYLRSGEITQPTDTSPAMATFTNILPPTKHTGPIVTESRLMKLLSHLHMNLLPSLTHGNLREILSLHSVPNDTDLGRKQSNFKRIEAVERVETRLDDMFIRGLPLRGTKINITVDPLGFASRGDTRLFGDVLDHFFGIYHHLNSYSKLTITEKNSPEVMSWPPRLGQKRLI